MLDSGSCVVAAGLHEVALPVGQLKSDAYGPNFLQFEWMLLANQFSFVPRLMGIRIK